MWDYLAITGSIYLSSVATLLIACCYWKRSNDWGAMATIVAGAAIPLGFLILKEVPATRQMALDVGPYYSGIAAYVGAAVAMVVGSLAKPVFTGRSGA
jgi:SSS family solute:Na+ symporter